MKQKEDLSKILCILTRAFHWTGGGAGDTWAGEVASNAWLPHVLAWWVEMFMWIKIDLLSRALVSG